MRWLRAIIGEIFGLFVDEISFALAIVGWIAVAWLVLPQLAVGSGGGPVLFVGLAAILVESVLRRARR